MFENWHGEEFKNVEAILPWKDVNLLCQKCFSMQNAAMK